MTILLLKTMGCNFFKDAAQFGFCIACPRNIEPNELEKFESFAGVSA